MSFASVRAAVLELWAKITEAFWTLVLYAFIAALIALPFFGYFYASSEGYIPHSVDTSLSAQSNWLVGESKMCHSYALNATNARLSDRKEGSVIGPIVCDDGPMHMVKVTLYGRLEQPEHKFAYWRCTRDADQFTCRQTGAE
jgi:hypothetical protein